MSVQTKKSNCLRFKPKSSSWVCMQCVGMRVCDMGRAWRAFTIHCAGLQRAQCCIAPYGREERRRHEHVPRARSTMSNVPMAPRWPVCAPAPNARACTTSASGSHPTRGRCCQRTTSVRAQAGRCPQTAGLGRYSIYNASPDVAIPAKLHARATPLTQLMPRQHPWGVGMGPPSTQPKTGPGENPQAAGADSRAQICNVMSTILKLFFCQAPICNVIGTR